MARYVVCESYMFGVNYFDKSGRVYPDYELEKTRQAIPTFDNLKQAQNMADRFLHAQVQTIE